MPETKQELKRRLGVANKEIARLKSQTAALSIGATQQPECDAKTTNKSQSTTKPKVVGHGEIAGKFVFWIFGVGLGCLSNYLSSSPEVLYFSCSTFVIMLLWFAWRRGRNWLVVSVGVSFVLFFCVHKYVGSVSEKSVPPSISLEVDPSLSPKDPFGTMLIIKSKTVASHQGIEIG
jgi:hypothetical protein